MNQLKNLRFAIVATILTFAANLNAQTLNQAASWPNANWTVGGVYSSGAAVFINDPRVHASFTFDDDEAGQNSDDVIWAASPVIDLSAAEAAGENTITVSGMAIYVTDGVIGDVLSLEYYNADLQSWVNFYNFVPVTTGLAYTNCNNIAQTAYNGVINISNFTPTMLSGFRYRVHFDDNGGWAYGFCVNSPTITSSVTCAAPSTLTDANLANTTADLGWTENGSSNFWDVEVVTAGTPQTYLPTGGNTPNNPYQATGLTQGTNYEFYVRARCTNDPSTWTGPHAFSTTGTPACPDPSAGSASNITASSADLGWTENGSATAWDIEVIAGGGTPTGTPTNAGVTGNPSTVSGLSASTTYDFYVRSSCGTSNSNYAGPFTFTTAAAGCSDPSTLAAANETSTTANLSWTENGSATTWDLEIVATGATPTGTPTDVGVTANPFTATGLTASTTYDFYVRADCGSGSTSAFVGPFTFSTTAAPCADPSALASANETTTTADLSWTENGSATTWDVEIVASGATPTGTPTDVGVTANPFTATGLTASTTYDFYVRADCGSGTTSAFVGPFTFTTAQQAGCTDPSTLSASNISTTSADLSWTENGTATSWDIELVAGGTTPTGTATNTGVSNPFTATGLTLNTSYDFYVRSDCGGTQSNWVGPFNFSTIAGCLDPSDLGAVNVGDLEADLFWQANGSETDWELEVLATGGTPTGVATDFAATLPAYQVTGLTPGTGYDFYVRAQCGTDFSDWVGPFTFQTTANLAELENSLGVRIAPNPSTGEFNVHMNAQTATVERLVVLGTNGSVIKTIALENGQGTLNQSVDLAEFSKGMYFISIVTDQGNLTYKVSLK